MIVGAFLLAMAAQDPAATTPVTAPAVVEEDAQIPVVPLATPPPPAPPPPAARPSRVSPPPDRVEGLNDVATGAVQVAAGAGACCLGSCLAAPLVFVPVVGPVLVTVATPIVAGVAVGGAEVVVGDALGDKRGALLVPILTAVGLLAVGSAGSTAYSALVPLSTSNSVRVAQVGDVDIRAGGDVVIATVFSIAAVVVPAIIYQATAVAKETGDRGGLPGFFAPADPTGTRAAKAKTTTAPSPSSPASSSSTSALSTAAAASDRR